MLLICECEILPSPLLHSLISALHTQEPDQNVFLGASERFVISDDFYPPMHRCIGWDETEVYGTLVVHLVPADRLCLIWRCLSQTQTCTRGHCCLKACCSTVERFVSHVCSRTHRRAVTPLILLHAASLCRQWNDTLTAAPVRSSIQAHLSPTAKTRDHY